MTPFDVIALLILGVSALVGFLRGAVRELVTVVAFILAVLIALFSLRFSGPIFRASISPDWAANGLAILAVFAAAYILIRVAGGALTRGIHNTRALGMADRIVGVGFGLIRAFVVFGVFNLAFNAATPPERVPRWITGAVLYPLSSFSARALAALAPQGSAMAGKVAPVLENAVKEGSADRPKSSKGNGYGENQRDRMDALVEERRR
ncbi:MAG TPA: CvpA family protein [Caulobacteraceae bacterium]|jgi:membrane protein required for colicin V production